MPARRKRSKAAGGSSGGAADADLYAELEVDRNCSQEELRKQYKRLAMRFHPDKNVDNREAAEQRFKRISCAYEVLSDPARRKAYDQGGAEAVRDMEAGAPRGGNADADPFDFGFGVSDPFELFASFFGKNFFGKAGGKRGRGLGLFDLDDGDGFFGGAFSDGFFSGFPSGGHSAATSRSVSEQTFMRGGHQVRKRVTKTQAADGTRQTVEEEWVDGKKTATKTLGGAAPAAIEDSKAKRPRKASAKPAGKRQAK